MKRMTLIYVLPSLSAMIACAHAPVAPVRHDPANARNELRPDSEPGDATSSKPQRAVLPTVVDCSVRPHHADCTKWWECRGQSYCNELRDTFVYPEKRFALAFSVTLLMSSDSQREVWSAELSPGLGLWLAYMLLGTEAENPWLRMRLGLEVGGEIAGDRTSLFGDSIRTSMTAHAFWVGPQLRWYPDTSGRIAFHARAALGYAALSFKVREADWVSSTAHDASTWMLPVGAGVTLIRYGIMLEAGYTFSAEQQFSIGGGRWRGAYTRAGYHIRSSLVLRF